MIILFVIITTNTTFLIKRCNSHEATVWKKIHQRDTYEGTEWFNYTLTGHVYVLYKVLSIIIYESHRYLMNHQQLPD